ncbi:hypothetical protein DX912_17610 [Lysobacter soli]|uniref:Uncharacterized protein n=1 Tax=Lysobacter soli TaxID=453783 RepID=A0A3D8V8L4_9GAMM|nr:hypothetical protein DX912_17610 [Lysobacter soli]
MTTKKAAAYGSRGLDRWITGHLDPRLRGMTFRQSLWIPAFAGMTNRQSRGRKAAAGRFVT